MTPKEFMLDIVRAYQKARESCVPHAKVRRGRLHSISSIAEDVFARYLVSSDRSIEKIYVDQPLSFPGIHKRMYPDIAIVRNGTIAAFLDLKMDLGWKRNGLFDLCKRHREFICSVRGARCHLKDGISKERKELSVANTASYNIVIISRANINPKKLESQLAAAQALAPDVDVFILSDTVHPNEYGRTPEEIVDGLGVNAAEFEKLVAKLK